MTEHEQFTEISDKIHYSFPLDIIYDSVNNRFVKDIKQLENGETGYSIVNVREIIYTTKFMEKFKEYYYGKNEGTLYKIDGILENLDNPVQYLYNLIK